MTDNVQPDAGEQREESSGLLLSVDPLQGANNYKAAGDDSDGSDKGGLLGDDSSDSDGSDSTLGDDSDASDADGTDGGDSDGNDSGGGGGDGSDADGTDVTDADGTDTGLDADGMNPLGIGTGDADAK
jgi:hypothetical protein